MNLRTFRIKNKSTKLIRTPNIYVRMYMYNTNLKENIPIS